MNQIAGHEIDKRRGSMPRMRMRVPWISRVTKQFASTALAACIVALSSFGMPTAWAKQQCSAAKPSNLDGHWWSYRLIDGRKCWYEGKAMVSKSLLEWPQEASPQPGSSKEIASVVIGNPDNPSASPAWAPKDSDTFEARWRARVKEP
jgi:hypothetical protein